MCIRDSDEGVGAVEGEAGQVVGAFADQRPGVDREPGRAVGGEHIAVVEVAVQQELLGGGGGEGGGGLFGLGEEGTGLGREVRGGGGGRRGGQAGEDVPRGDRGPEPVQQAGGLQHGLGFGEGAQRDPAVQSLQEEDGRAGVGSGGAEQQDGAAAGPGGECLGLVGGAGGAEGDLEHGRSEVVVAVDVGDQGERAAGVQDAVQGEVQPGELGGDEGGEGGQPAVRLLGADGGDVPREPVGDGDLPWCCCRHAGLSVAVPPWWYGSIVGDGRAGGAGTEQGPGSGYGVGVLVPAGVSARPGKAVGAAPHWRARRADSRRASAASGRWGVGTAATRSA